jgi:hypothetical protein
MNRELKRARRLADSSAGPLRQVSRHRGDATTGDKDNDSCVKRAA